MLFVHESILPATPQQVYAFHERSDAFALLLPPWDRVVVEQPPSGLATGTRVRLRTRIGLFWVRIEALHIDCVPGTSFTDVMVAGPFARWRHDHLFLPHEQGCLLRDVVDCALPLGWLGRLAEPFAVRPRLRRLFAHRHAVTRREVLGAG